jgi:F-box protein 21
MTLHREGRYQLAANLASMSFDIWDALEIQCSLPVPTLFGGSATAVVAPYALTLRFWAEAILDAISRRFAVLRWARLNHETGNSVSFVDAFSSLSCFFGKPPQEVQSLFLTLCKILSRDPIQMQSQLLALGNACREYLIKQQCRLDQLHSDLPDICTKICEFMHQQGFGAVERACQVFGAPMWIFIPS